MKKKIDFLVSQAVKLVEKYLPDPYIFALVLTVFVFLLAFFVTDLTPVGILNAWYGGFWNLLAFTMQMALILVTGTILATTPQMSKLLGKLASLPKNRFQALYIVSLIALLSSFINWGFGLVVGAIFAKEVAARVKDVDYPLLVASAYSGFIVWHAGLSGSIPLSLATGGPTLVTQTGGAVLDVIPTGDTIFSLFNLVIVAVLILTLPLLFLVMHPKQEYTTEVDPNIFDEAKELMQSPKSLPITPAERLEQSRIINGLIVIMGFGFILIYFIENGFDLNLNIVNFIFLFTAIALHGTPIATVKAVNKAAQSVGGILLQFPFYAGIMGIMIARGTNDISIASSISNFFVSISSARTLPLFTFLSAGIVNIFVPSGGGQWAVQGPIMMPASQLLDANMARTAMAIAWGDAWTNMIQPFWALPALGIAKLGVRNIMGYCLIVLIYAGIVIGLGLLIL